MLVTVKSRLTARSGGYCIYCGKSAKDAKLRTEHIIPSSIGGKFELIEASCKECEVEVGRFEGSLLKGPLYVQRIACRYKSRKHGRKRTHVEFWNHRQKRKVSINIKSFPVYFMTYTYANTPSFFRGVYGNPHPNGGPLLIHREGTRLFWFKINALVSQGFARKDLLPDLNVTDFSRWLAKIAHSYTCALLKPEHFQPYLPKFILGTTPYLAGPLIGNAELDTQPRARFPPPIHHHTHLNFQSHAKGILVVAWIWLFGQSITWAHQVVVGRLRITVDELQSKYGRKVDVPVRLQYTVGDQGKPVTVESHQESI